MNKIIEWVVRVCIIIGLMFSAYTAIMFLGEMVKGF